MNIDHMPADKYHNVMNAAITEFGKGYKHASTDSIIEMAGISKGLLFHYFGSKQKLFAHVFDYVIMLAESKKNKNSNPVDILDDLIEKVYWKINMMNAHGGLSQFFFMLYHTKEDILLPYQEKFFQWVALEKKAFYQNIDPTIYKEGIDPEMAVKVIEWTVEGISKKYEVLLETIKDLDSEMIKKDIFDYSKFLKKIFYKELTNE